MKRLVFAIICALVIFQVAVFADEPLEVTFSHEAGFYSEGFSLALSAPSGARIFYTLDGSIPTTGSRRHTTPISVQVGSSVRLVSVRAIAVSGDETSEIATRNFFTGRNIRNRFCENTLIFALNSDPHGLFDHYEGIFVEGVDRERWRQDYFNRTGRWPVPGYAHYNESPASPANFNRRGRDSEREVHVEVFDNEGNVHISQRAGMRVRGGFSRAANQKSVELYAREEYGDRNNFRFAFFDDEFDYRGRLIDRYRRIRLRNGGTDRGTGFVRDELSQALFRQAGHSTTQTHRPAAFFLNGEYYGVAWLKTPRTPNHLSRKFGGVSANFGFAEGGDRRLATAWWDGEERAASDLHEVSAIAMQGFTGAGGDERFEEFARRICVDDLIRYYAMQIYLNNYDWPNHNMELWRYFPTDEERRDTSLHPYLRDGRWRVFAHDLEAGWAIFDNYNRMAREDTLRDVLRGENNHRWNSGYSSAFLYALVGRPETRAQLANTFVDLIEGAFAPDNIIATLDDLVSQIENEHHYAIRAGTFANRYWPTIQSARASQEAIRRFARARPNVMLTSVQTNLGFNQNNRFAVNLTTSSGGGAMMNSRPVPESSSVTGNYFANTSIRITAIPNPGFEIDHWMVGSTRHTSNTRTIIADSDVDVRIYFRSLR
ncbi:MAG: CotH kinase family protein [Defluviitaleaceae bacterium]|nr:CotH kinase family protein [Defluviitaleaceae bacterium]